jgi:hypothetical protein
MASATAAATVVHCCVRVEPMYFLVRKVIEISPCLIVAGCRVIRPRLVRLLRPNSRHKYKISAWTGALQFLYQPPISVWRAGLSPCSKKGHVSQKFIKYLGLAGKRYCQTLLEKCDFGATRGPSVVAERQESWRPHNAPPQTGAGAVQNVALSRSLARQPPPVRSGGIWCNRSDRCHPDRRSGYRQRCDSSEWRQPSSACVP